MLEKIRDNWWIIPVIGCLIAFGGRLQAIASSPAQIQKTSESVDKLAESLNQYVTSQEAYKQFVDYRLQQLEKEKTHD